MSVGTQLRWGGKHRSALKLMLFARPEELYVEEVWEPE